MIFVGLYRIYLSSYYISSRSTVRIVASMFSPLVFGSSDPGSSPEWGHS